MSGSPNVGISIALYTVGILLVVTAVLILLKAFGLLTTLSNDVIVALVLLSVGVGIISGMRSSRGRY